MIDFLLGQIAMAAAIAGLIFLRYFQRTRDRFFLFFTASFWLESGGRVLSVLYPAFDDRSDGMYILRFLAYALILAAIADKNLTRGRKS